MCPLHGGALGRPCSAYRSRLPAHKRLQSHYICRNDAELEEEEGTGLSPSETLPLTTSSKSSSSNRELQDPVSKALKKALTKLQEQQEVVVLATAGAVAVAGLGLGLLQLLKRISSSRKTGIRTAAGSRHHTAGGAKSVRQSRAGKSAGGAGAIAAADAGDAVAGGELAAGSSSNAIDAVRAASVASAGSLGSSGGGKKAKKPKAAAAIAAEPAKPGELEGSYCTLLWHIQKEILISLHHKCPLG